MNQELTIKKIVEICKGSLFSGDENTICKTFTKDTRTINRGDTYIGIKGEKFDGTHFYKDAFLKGANACILDKDSFKIEKDYSYDLPIILVSNTLEALESLAIYTRNNSSAKFIGVTGSVGKTSTKDMIYSVLNTNFKTLKTEGNYNNNIGLPLTMLRLKDEDCAVLEMGMSALGEIDYLSKIARPHIGVITNIGTAHIGQLGGRENILKAKLEILNGMNKDGILIINNDNDLLHDYYLKNKDKKNIITIGINNESTYQATNILIDENQAQFDILYQNTSRKIVCPIPSISFVFNSLVAFAIGNTLNIKEEKIISGISSFELTKNRLEILNLKNNVTLINGAYNANVESMLSSLEILKMRPEKRKIAILGSMINLGEYSYECHEKVGNCVYESNIDILVTVGKEAKVIASTSESLGMKKENIYSFSNNEDAINFLKSFINEGDALLVKASNDLHFNEIIEVLKTYN